MPERFRDRRLAEVYAWWCAKRAGRLAPLRADCDPAELPHLRPIFHLIDVIEEPLRFRHAWVGSEVVGRMGRDVSGQFVDEALYGSAVEEIRASLAIVAREVRPYRRLARMEWHGEGDLEIEAIELPLLDVGGAVCAILRAASIDERPAAAGRPARRLDFQPMSCLGAATTTAAN